MSRDDATILDIVKAARRILDFKGSLDKPAFMTDSKTQSAVLHQLLVIGEAVKRLSGDFRERRPEIPWKEIAGMRDKVIHVYNDVDLSEVWETVSTDVPALISILEPLARLEEDRSESGEESP